MKHWRTKVAVVTDCEDEVGFNVIDRLAKAGMITIGFAKSDNVIKKTTDKLKHFAAIKTYGEVVLCKCDITILKQLKIVFDRIIKTYGGVDVLINNAYCNDDCLISTGEIEQYKKLIDTNINSLVACTRLAASSMIERKSRGHIINVNDLCAYEIPEITRKSVFIATRAAMTSVNEILRLEFRYLNANIKVTNIACGSIESANVNTESQGNKHKLKIKDVAKLVKLILDTPEHLQVHEVLLDSTAYDCDDDDINNTNEDI